MKKYLIIAASAAAVLAAGCAKNEVIQNQGPGDAVSFGVYVPKTVTKAGKTGKTTTDTIKSDPASGGGFGVFAYYTDNKSYADAVTAGDNTPNFMYNQLVYFDTTPDPDQWTYSPIKYWPNETGAGAHSEGVDHISFFAYAPYVSAGSGSSGITGMIANDDTDDPTIDYAIATDPDQVVDLCWAVKSDGLPWLNQTKQTVTGTIDFTFKHALARLSVNVRGFFDAVRTSEGQISGDEIDSNTKITIEKIDIKGNFTPSATLNLNNTSANTALWQNIAGDAEKTLTISNSQIAASLRATEGGETGFPGSSVTGVKKSNVNVFTGSAPSNADVKYFTFIPRASTTLNVKITYYVTTQDTNLDGGYVCVKNVIDQPISFDFACGKNYNLNIVLGMTTVKLEATVEDWAAVTVDKDIDLPVNTAS